jgi:hypothetical protein
MKKLYIISWIVLLTGLIFKFLHIPGNGSLLTLSGLLLLIHSIIHLIKFAKTNLSISLLYLSFAFITIYLIVRLQFWPCPIPLFLFICILTLCSIVVNLVNRTKFQFSQILLILYFVLFYTISYVPAYKMYYSIRLNTILNGKSRNSDYRSWDKYSWFLYLRDKQAEALEANMNAANALELYLKNSNDNDAGQYLTIIKQHEQKIKDKNWIDYK